MTLEQFTDWFLSKRDIRNKTADPEKDEQFLEVRFTFNSAQFSAEDLYRIVNSACDNRERFDYEYLPGFVVCLDGEYIYRS